jgi:SAM-dependent methyltransferase
VSTGARYSLGFVRAAMPEGARRLLEVGCGDGALAAMLAADGLEVVAIDTDPAAVAGARARGVDARIAEWPAFDAGPFDAVLFTRSLHHVADLGASVAAAFAALAPGGRVLVEDFAFEEADSASLAWFRTLAARLGAEPPADWDAHDHDLHSARAMEAALGTAARGCAYYFRYVETAAPTLAEAALAEEEEAIAAGLIRPLGRRWIAPIR